ncbi:MAG TPA: hypothetical protein VLJ17_20355 [Xanthobacteraceae bacterium]|jgi:hypothetical protein|nr:hypothetical protein [Xanthobacteraceae bacterium]
MKRSNQVSLVLMAAAGIGAAAYAWGPNDNCRQPAANTVPNDPQQGAARQVSAQDCRSSRSGSSGRSYSFFSSNSGSTGPDSAGATHLASNASSASVSRGGFGSIGRALASFSGGG